MKFLKLVLIGIVTVFLVVFGIKLLSVLVGVAMKILFFLLIGLAALALWKIFGPKGTKHVEDAEPPNKFQNPELTLEEYKRKLETQLKEGSEKRS